MSKKIKILYLIDSFSLGGAEKFLLNLCRNLDKEDFEIHVAAVVFGGTLEDEFRSLGIEVKIFNKKGKLSLPLIWQLRRYIKQINPDIVHTNLFGADTWGRIAAILAKTPIIISTEHNVNLDEPHYKKLIKLILSWFTTKIIAISEGVRDYSIKVEKIKSAKIKLIYYGIDLDKFNFRGYRQIDLTKPINAVTVGRLVPQKGHKFLIEALPLIMANYPNFKLHIIGAGKLENDLKEQVKGLGLEESVIFYGQRLDVENIFPKMDLFILPSLWEGLGLVLLEAQAVGVPILAADIPSVSEIIKDEETGLLFPVKNSPAIGQKVNYLLSYPAIAQKIVNNAHNIVSEKFSLRKMVDNYSSLYKQLIKNRE